MKQQSLCYAEAHLDAVDCNRDVQVESTARRPRLEIDEPARALVALAQTPSAAHFRSSHLSRFLAVVASGATYCRNSDLNCQCHSLSASASLRGMNFHDVLQASLHFAMVTTTPTTTTMMMTQLTTSQQRPAGAEDTVGVVAAMLCPHGATASHSFWPAKDADLASAATIDFCLPSHARNWPGHRYRL
jgi:hypothetical protein